MLYGIREAAFEREIEASIPQCVNLTSQEIRTLGSLNEKFYDKKVLTPEEKSLRGQLLGKFITFQTCKNAAMDIIKKKSWERETDDIKRMEAYDNRRPAPRQSLPNVDDLFPLR